MMKCPKCKEYSTKLGATIYVCRQHKEILNPTKLLELLEELGHEVPSIKTSIYENFLEEIRKYCLLKETLEE